MSTPPLTASSSGTQKAVGAGTIATSATAMVACAACCALPMMFPALALGASGAFLAWIAGSLAWIRIVAGLAVVAAWVWVFWERRTHGRVRRSTLIMLSISTVMTGIAFAWELIEPALLGALK